jgi:hypothetical protein
VEAGSGIRRDIVRCCWWLEDGKRIKDGRRERLRNWEKRIEQLWHDGGKRIKDGRRERLGNWENRI